jgi:hypothetical protein
MSILLVSHFTSQLPEITYSFLVNVVSWVVTADDDIVLFALTVLELDAGDMKSLFDKGETEAGRRRKLYHLKISVDMCKDLHLRMRLYRIQMVLLC